MGGTGHAHVMKVKARTHTIGIALYSLPFLAIIGLSLFFVWAGDTEMIFAGVALLPAVMYFVGVRWCRYVVGVLAAICLLICSMIPILRGSDGRYFWLIWSPIWLLFAFSSLVAFVPVRQKPNSTDGMS